MSSHAPKPQVAALLQQIEHNFASAPVLRQRWELIAVAALAGGNDPRICADLYLYLIAKPEFSTPEARRGLTRRIREALVKLVCIVGVCKPIEAVLAINAVEREEDKDHTTTREGWQCDAANLEHGNNWMRQIYTHNMEYTMGLFRDHKDFEWLSRNITYGLFLSDRQVLDDIDTEMVVLVGIMIQNLQTESHWHIRGSRRLGITKEEMQVTWDSVMAIAGHLGLSLDRVPTVDEIEPEV